MIFDFIVLMSFGLYKFKFKVILVVFIIIIYNGIEFKVFFIGLFVFFKV